MTIRIEKLSTVNKQEWLALWQGYLIFYKEQLPQEITDLTWDRVVNPNEPVNGFALYNDDKMVGFVHYVFHLSTWAKSNYCYLEDLFVAEEARGNGCARTLIYAVRDAAKANNSERLYWVTGESNVVAQGLYNKMAEKTEYFQYRLGVE